MRYIELNPLRAQMVAHPADYAWSSYLHNAEGKTDPAIIAHPLYTLLGNDQATRCHAYRALFSAHIAPDQLHAIRHTVNKELVLGSGAFKQQVENMLNRQTEERPRGRPRKTRGIGEY
jgi:putative transposase